MEFMDLLKIYVNETVYIAHSIITVPLSPLIYLIVLVVKVLEWV